MTSPVITLDVDGIIEDPVVKANRLFAYYMKSNFSQSTAYYGTVHSFKHDVRTAGMDKSEIALVVRKALTALFTPHFTSVNIDTRIVSDDSPTYTLIASGVLIDGNTRHDLKQSITFSNDEFIEEQASYE